MDELSLKIDNLLQRNINDEQFKKYTVQLIIVLQGVYYPLGLAIVISDLLDSIRFKIIAFTLKLNTFAFILPLCKIKWGDPERVFLTSFMFTHKLKTTTSRTAIIN